MDRKPVFEIELTVEGALVSASETSSIGVLASEASAGDSVSDRDWISGSESACGFEPISETEVISD